MLRAPWVQTALQYALCILAFLIPFPFIFGSYAIVLLSLLWILNGDFKGSFQRFKANKVLWAWVAYYVLNALSYFYSENKGQSLFDIGAKMSILLLPFVIGAGTPISKKLFERVLVFFISSLSIVAVISIIHAIVRCYREGYIYKPFFFYHDLVAGFDSSAVYMALYCLFSLACLLMLQWQHFFTGKYKWVKVLLIVWQILFFILLSSRLLIILFFILLVPFYIRKAFKHKGWGIGRLAIIAVFFAIIGGGVFTTDNPVKNRFNDMFQKDLSIAWQDDYSQIPQDSFSNVTLRLMLWRFGYENMQEHNLWLKGAGNGDAVDLQNQKLEQHGFDIDAAKDNVRSEFYNINLHNMFFQVLMMIGIPGLLLYIIMVFSPLLALQGMEYRHIFFVFHVSMLFFMFQEAIFQTQAGIVFYSVFSMIFWNLKYKNDNQ